MKKCTTNRSISCRIHSPSIYDIDSLVLKSQFMSLNEIYTKIQRASGIATLPEYNIQRVKLSGIERIHLKLTRVNWNSEFVSFSLWKSSLVFKLMAMPEKLRSFHRLASKFQSILLCDDASSMVVASLNSKSQLEHWFNQATRLICVTISKVNYFQNGHFQSHLYQISVVLHVFCKIRLAIISKSTKIVFFSTAILLCR